MDAFGTAWNGSDYLKKHEVSPPSLFKAIKSNDNLIEVMIPESHKKNRDQDHKLFQEKRVNKKEEKGDMTMEESSTITPIDKIKLSEMEKKAFNLDDEDIKRQKEDELRMEKEREIMRINENAVKDLPQSNITKRTRLIKQQKRSA